MIWRWIQGVPCQSSLGAQLKDWFQSSQRDNFSSETIHLRDIQGNSIPVVGIGLFRVTFKSFKGPLRLAEGPCPSLLGQDWFAALHLEVMGIDSVSYLNVESLEKDFADVFNSTLGQYTGSAWTCRSLRSG